MADIVLEPPGRIENFHSWLNVTTSLVTPTQSQLRAAGLAYVVTSWVPGLVLVATYPIPLGYSAGLAILTWGYAAVNRTLKKCHQVNVPVQHVGVRLVNGMPVNILYVPGDHILYFGEDLALVFVGPGKFDPPAFTELAKDDVDVEVDGYFVAHVEDPYLWYTQGGPQTADLLIKSFIAKIRLFISNFNEAKEMVEMRDLLAEFLALRCDDGVGCAAFRENKLLPLTLGDKPMLTVDAVDAIMEDAGEFCTSADKWGYRVTEINTEDVDLPEEILKAANERAALEDVLANKQAKQTMRLEMIDEMKKKLPGLSDQDAVANVDIILDLAVKREIRDFSVRGLQGVIDPAAASVIAPVVASYLNKETGNVKQRKQPKRGR